MTLAGLAEASGLQPRTIRFYIARGLLNGPAKGGRGAEYTADHVARLERIKRLQAAGRTLSQIGSVLRGVPLVKISGVAASPWWHYDIAEDVVVSVKAGASPWRTKQVRAALEEFARRVRVSNGESGKESEET